MALPLPDKPSIAVLAFANLSDDPEQEYFADGMAEEVITGLSKISGLFVIARNSSFSYKGLNVKVRQVAEELGVRYVLEGSVRRADEAAEAIERAIRLDPFHLLNYLEWLGDAYLLLGRYDDCIRTTERGWRLIPISSRSMWWRRNVMQHLETRIRRARREPESFGPIPASRSKHSPPTCPSPTLATWNSR